MLRRVPVNRSVAKDIDEWIKWQLFLCEKDKREIVEDCLKHFTDRYAILPEEKWREGVEDEIATTMASLVVQPALMEGYRRFVVITGKADAQTLTTRDGVRFSLSAHPEARAESRMVV